MAVVPATTGWRALLAAALLAICWLAFSAQPPPDLDTGWDKSNHLGAFAVLAFCAERGFGRQAWRRWAPALLGFGIFIELVQSQVPGRSAEVSDVLADAVGIGLGVLLAAAWRRLQRTAID